MKKKTVQKNLMRMLIVMTVCTVIFVFSACGAKYADSEYLGTWKAKTASMSGINLDVGNVFGEFTIKLEEDGTAKVTIDKEKQSGDWEETKNGFKLKDGSDEMEFKKNKKGKTVLNYKGMTIDFEKQ